MQWFFISRTLLETSGIGQHTGSGRFVSKGFLAVYHLRANMLCLADAVTQAQ